MRRDEPLGVTELDTPATVGIVLDVVGDNVDFGGVLWSGKCAGPAVGSVRCNSARPKRSR